MTGRVFSSAVKRLQDKAQVFPLESHDSIRTQLTHSLEVATVSRRLARSVGREMVASTDITQELLGSIEDISATCALIHDLGNPPFGHAGEDAIRHWFDERFGDEGPSVLPIEPRLKSDFTRFDGNAQTLRIVTKLQASADFTGLNLTYGTLSACCKYVTASDQADPKQSDHARRKMGFFCTEADIVERIRSETGTGLARNPISYLVEAADDIVNAASDLEDAMKKGVLTWEELRPTMTGGPAEVSDVFRKIEGRMAEAVTSNPDAGGPYPTNLRASAFRTAAISVLVGAAKEGWQTHYEEIMAGTFTGDLLSDGSCGAYLKALTHRVKVPLIYANRDVVKLELTGQRIISDLLDGFWWGARDLSGEETGPDVDSILGRWAQLLSPNYVRVFRQARTESPHFPVEYHRLQLIVDYVCGMTDAYAKRLHSELMNG